MTSADPLAKSHPTLSASSSTDGRARALLELASVLLFAVGSKLALDQIIWRFSGPVSLAITLGLLTLYLRQRGERWSQMGLWPISGGRAKLLMLPQILLGAIGIIGTGIVVSQLGDGLGLWSLADTTPNVDDRFGELQGNLPNYLLWVGLSWISGGLAEEMFFRGFLITWASRVFSGTRSAPILGVLFAAFCFGYGHFYYQGFQGWVVTGAIGLTLGLLYLLYKRNLWPLVIAHALVDSLGFTLQFAGIDA